MAALETIIRASSLSGYADCPRRTATKLIPGEIRAAGYELRQLSNGIGATVGSSVHAAAQVTLQEKLERGTPAPLSVAHDAAIETLHGKLAEGVTFDRETPQAKDAETQVLRMARVYHELAAPRVAPILVERRLEAEFAPGLVLSGQADVLAHEPGAVDDLKTGKMRGHHKPQVGGYGLLARANDYEISQGRETFIQRVPVKKAQPEPLFITHDLGACETAALNVLRHIEGDLQTWREGDPRRGVQPHDPWAFAANPASKLCSDKWCPAWGTAFCREHRTEGEE